MAGDRPGVGQLGADARPVAVVDVGRARHAVSGLVVAVEEDQGDHGECEENQHGSKSALR
ncbi:hypothetical protein GCM10010171_03310 [Actinokineospora fastidiosa]|uniref:Uncharacterized protein n=1 Tax=Actinokineospora fastidiosa TaxID=1816 RepID=A0A918L6E6_9PSEU|nr:hypothetical protein GCM10010171_03310 [Actinokineospora fastidiosa]